ncbi:MAG: ATP synthase F1 subunit epsilon [Clostridia bacterium]|nr:ATP synthase F1 subunit epsilon [Clostridia bacterium]MBR3681231.1 ATP synthase F1 subunit epsilon [Clostridia bacterium]
MKGFNLEIVTPDGLAFSGEAESLLVHTDDGDVEILAGHMDYMASVATGRARIITGGVSKFASCSGGFLTVLGGEVRLAAVTFEFADKIDVERAKKAKERAESKLTTATDEREIALAKARLERALTRIKVAGL